MIEEDESQRAAMKEEIRKSVREEIQNSRNPQVTNFLVERQIWLVQLPELILKLSPLLQVVHLHLIVRKGQRQVIPIDLAERNLEVVQ